MNSDSTVYENGEYVQDTLFDNPFYATGRPITEAYWADVLVAGTEQLVPMQCFERRCLTYTPGNAPEWQVESGNVGRHYQSWRYAWPDVSGKLLFVDREYSPQHDSLVSNISLIDFAPDGLARINLTNHTESDEGSSAWSSDGNKIAFTKQISENEIQIFLINADGTNERQLTFIPPGEGVSFSSSPDWSPDGTQIVFSNINGPLGPGPRASSIYVINVDGTGLTELAQSRGDGNPIWSPDGEKIAFEMLGGGDEDFSGGTVFVMDSDGSNFVNLKVDDTWPERNDYRSPAWSPDSSKIAYARADGIFLTDPDGSNQTRLTIEGDDPTWSPDGRHIAFSFNGGLVVMDSDGGNQAQITMDIVREPAWRP